MGTVRKLANFPPYLDEQINELIRGINQPKLIKNHIINGDFDIWQRGTSFSIGDLTYTADRWLGRAWGSSATVSQQAFTLGQTAVPGEPTYFLRTSVTSVSGAANAAFLEQRIESVRTLAGQTATLSFWAKADGNKPIAIDFGQVFGTGGTPSSAVTRIGTTKLNLTTSWRQYIVTINLPSIAGKVLGTNNNDYLSVIFWFDAGTNYDFRTNSLGQQSGVFDIAQVQLEKGSMATDFEWLPLQQKMVLCQRFYEIGNVEQYLPWPSSTGYKSVWSAFNVSKRAFPTIVIAADGTINRIRISDTPTYSTNIFKIPFYNGINVGITDTISISCLKFNYTADAEL